MNRPWTVFHPGPLRERRPGVWTVDDQVPGLRGLDRRMTVVRRDDGSLVFFNAVPVPDETLAQLRALGSPRALVVPNRYHALDAASFAARLGLETFAPRPAVEALADRMTCRPPAQFPAGDDVRLVTVDGFRTEEVVLQARDTLVVGDLFTNVPHAPGVRGWVFRLLGFSGPAPRLPFPVRKRVGRDLKAVAALLERLADDPQLTRLIPSHGGVVEDGARAALRQVAQQL